MAENDNKQLLHPLLTDPKSLIAEYRKRFKIYNFKSVSQKNLEKYNAKGWEYDRKLKKTTRIKMMKGFDEYPCHKSGFLTLGLQEKGGALVSARPRRIHWRD